MASQQPNVAPYSPNALPPNSKAGQTGDCNDSGFNIEFNEHDSDYAPYGESPNNPNSSRDEETNYLQLSKQATGNGPCDIVIGNNTQQPTMPKHVTSDTISKDQQCWEAFLKQDIEDHFTTGKIFEVSKNIFLGKSARFHGSHDNYVSIYVRESFKPFFKAITEEPSSPSSVPYIITGTLGVGISSFGFYLLRHLIEQIGPGKSILYQYTLCECLKYVRIMRTNGLGLCSFEVTCYDASSTFSNLKRDYVSWYVCDGKSHPFNFRTIEIQPSPLSYDTNSAKCFYMPLWEWEEVEKMLIKVYPESWKKWLSDKEKKDYEFVAKKKDIFKTFQKAVVQIHISMRNSIADEFEQDLEKVNLSNAAKRIMNKAQSEFNKSYMIAKQKCLDEMDKETAKFDTQTELEEQHFHQLSDARWAFKYIGKLPSAYLHTEKSQRLSEKDRLDREIKDLLMREDVLELQFTMGNNHLLPPDVSPRMLHVTCDYDGNKPNFKKSILRVASDYVMEKLFEVPMPEGRARRCLEYLALKNLPPHVIGMHMFEPAVHTLIKRGRYKAHELGTCKSPQKTPKETTLDIDFKSYNKVNSFHEKESWSIEIKTADKECYCVPSLPDFPVIDSLIPLRMELFQITIGSTHLVNTKRLYEILTQLKWLDKVADVKLIFIVLQNKNDQFTAQGPEKADEVDSKEYEKFAQIKQYRLVFPQDPEPL